MTEDGIPSKEFLHSTVEMDEARGLNHSQELQEEKSGASSRLSSSRQADGNKSDVIEIDVPNEHAREADLEKQNSVQHMEHDGTKDPNIVSWDGPDDPANPMNWNTGLKVSNIAIISAMTFVTPLASSMFAPGVPSIMTEFQSTNVQLATFVVSVYVLGFALGPMILAPASELYGRLYIYHICNIGFVIFTVACALSTNLNMLIAFRFLQGCFGSCPLTNGGGTIADIVPQAKRGGVLAIYALGPILGPVIGPVAGGYLASSKGWRWVFWVLCMLSGLFAILALLFLRESYATIILNRKAARLRKETGNPALRSALASDLNAKDLFWRSVVRPTKMVVFSPVVLLCSLYTGVVYGYLYLMFTTFTDVFEEQYRFSTSSVGLTFLGLGIGSLIGLFFCGIASDRILKAKAKPTPEAPSGVMKPEYRLPPLLPGSVLIPAGLFIYGWTAQYRVHYVVPIFGTLLIGIGNMTVFMCMTTYLVDAFTIYAASALAANTVIRSAMGALLPLAGLSMYSTLGLGWGNSLMGFVAVALLPVPWILQIYGERLRNSFDSDRL